jgi:hypothetical protein
MDKIIITTFTDPMMGLTYECEPIYDKLKELYGDALEFKYIMAGLVRDVSDFMTPDELSLPAKEGIRKYNKRLAGIYKSEESIGGLPINMNGYCSRVCNPRTVTLGRMRVRLRRSSLAG